MTDYARLLKNAIADQDPPSVHAKRAFNRLLRRTDAVVTREDAEAFAQAHLPEECNVEYLLEGGSDFQGFWAQTGYPEEEKVEDEIADGKTQERSLKVMTFTKFPPKQRGKGKFEHTIHILPEKRDKWQFEYSTITDPNLKKLVSPKEEQTANLKRIPRTFTPQTPGTRKPEEKHRDHFKLTVFSKHATELFEKKFVMDYETLSKRSKKNTWGGRTKPQSESLFVCVCQALQVYENNRNRFPPRCNLMLEDANLITTENETF